MLHGSVTDVTGSGSCTGSVTATARLRQCRQTHGNVEDCRYSSVNVSETICFVSGLGWDVKRELIDRFKVTVKVETLTRSINSRTLFTTPNKRPLTSSPSAAAAAAAAESQNICTTALNGRSQFALYEWIRPCIRMHAAVTCNS